MVPSQSEAAPQCCSKSLPSSHGVLTTTATQPRQSWHSAPRMAAAIGGVLYIAPRSKAVALAAAVFLGLTTRRVVQSPVEVQADQTDGGGHCGGVLRLPWVCRFLRRCAACWKSMNERSCHSVWPISPRAPTNEAERVSLSRRCRTRGRRTMTTTSMMRRSRRSTSKPSWQKSRVSSSGARRSDHHHRPQALRSTPRGRQAPSPQDAGRLRAVGLRGF